ncbi:hypothetical protein ACHAWU_004287 [Discostella pseudostelligera]|uniref:ATP-dependent RNA helicase n=1 Tax=Discostella pseudostelligera TaxID=259834 RepID=A0ABD3M3T0_9STRA
MQLVECDDESSTDLHKDTDKGSININELNNATPRQLAQLFIVVSAKLRLAALIAFLSARAAKGERTVVFLSTCDSVDYHHALLTSMESTLGSGKDVVDDEVESSGIFGKACPIFKLHGDIPHNKRMTTINDFNSNQQSAILLATDNAAGCSAGYGDYIIGMEEYLQAYFEAVEEDQKYSCEYEKNYGDCICNGENQGDDFNAEYCEYDCYMGKGMEYCVDKNPYEENNGNNNKQNQEMELREMAECRQLEANNNNNNRRQLEDAQAAYYLGAYCSENGGSIHLGLFTEDICSQFADANAGATTYASLTGKSLPYSGTTLIGSECMSCKEPQEVNQNGENQNNANDQEDADQVKEVCEQLYANSGKCEANLSNSNVKYPNNNACNFMQGIKIVRKNGTIIRGAGSLNTTASIFIGLFACSFVLIGGCVYYLKTKLDRARVNLSE